MYTQSMSFAWSFSGPYHGHHEGTMLSYQGQEAGHFSRRLLFTMSDLH